MKNVNLFLLKLSPIKNIMIIIVFWGLLFPGRAEAYLDPTSGGFLIEIIVGGVAGIIAIYKFYGAKARDFIKRFKKSTD